MRSLTLLTHVSLLFSRVIAVPVVEAILEASIDDWASRQWDAIVIGAGTAGIIVADRLSEAGHSTLLLERGGASYGITGGHERPDWLKGTNLSRVDVPGLCKFHNDFVFGKLCSHMKQTRASSRVILI